jgi:outer membrane protein assembly factor BamB
MHGRCVRGRTFQIASLILVCSALGEEWTRFRGPNGSGISSETGYPIHFSKEQNLIWRAPVRAGKSSPVLTNKHVFLTGVEDGKLFTQCFDRGTGKLLWERTEQRTHKEDVQPLNNPAGSTPATDGDNVYVFFKDFGLVSYDGAGKLRWRLPLGPFTNSMGLGSSPIVSGEQVLLVVDQMAESFIVAVDSRSGQVRWRAPRPESDSWATPLLYNPPGASPMILTAGYGLFGAHRVSDGKRMFSHHGLATAVIASPVMDNDVIFAFGYGYESSTPDIQVLPRWDKNNDGQISPDEYGDRNPVMAAIGRYVGNRDGIVTKDKWEVWERHVKGGTNLVAVRISHHPTREEGDSVSGGEIWRHEKGFAGVIPSPLLYDRVLYVIRNGGILTAFDAATGEVLKAGRVDGAIGGYSASPVAAGGNIYFLSEDGKVAVVRAGRDWQVIAVNDLGESAYATPALSHGRVYLRTVDALYCFGAQPKPKN